MLPLDCCTEGGGRLGVGVLYRAQMMFLISAVVQSFDDCTEVVSRQTQKSFTKREMTVVDQTQKAVRVTLWGGDAEKFQVTEDNPTPVIAIKVSDCGLLYY